MSVPSTRSSVTPNLTAKQSERFEASYRASLKTGKAWGFKELLRDLWNHDSIPEAKAFFDDWFRRGIRTNLTPLKKVARAIKERLSKTPLITRVSPTEFVMLLCIF